MGIILHPYNLTVPGLLVWSFGHCAGALNSKGAAVALAPSLSFDPFGDIRLRVTRGILGSLLLVYDLVVGIDHVALAGLGWLRRLAGTAGGLTRATRAAPTRSSCPGRLV